MTVPVSRALGGGGAVRTCEVCGAAFVQYEGGAPQRLCPTHTDIAQQRPTIIQNRDVLALIEGVKVGGLPGEWEKFLAQDGDQPRWCIDVRGQRYGATWSGRIVVWARRPIAVGEVVRLRHMAATHRVKAVRSHRATLRHGRVPVRRVEHFFDAGDEAQEELERHEYVVLEPTPGTEPRHELVFVEARTKTTLKGYGRQYWANLSGAPLWHQEIRGGYRSGRAYTTAWLAVVDDEHPVIVTSTGDISYTERYPKGNEDDEDEVA